MKTKFSVGYIIIGDKFNGDDPAEEEKFLKRVERLLEIAEDE